MNLSEDRVRRCGAQRVMAYCHDSVGIGHVRRTLTICERLRSAQPGLSFLLATGTPFLPLFEPVSGVDAIKLPALCKSRSGVYASKYLSIPLSQLLACRAALLRQAAQSFAPDVLLVDKAPLGVCGELLPTLRWLRAHRPQARIVFGMRDVEDAPERTRRQWQQAGIPQALERYFDEIWVYGMQALFDVVRAYDLPQAVGRRIVYTGYVVRPPCRHPAPPALPRPLVLVTVGGGTDGEHLLATYLASTAGRVAALGGFSILVGGPDLPTRAARTLRRRAASLSHVGWEDFAPCLRCRIRQADLVVTMGGYNTLCEIAAQRKPALVIPRTHPRLEQQIRGELWQRRGAAFVLSAPTPATLADRVAELLGGAPARTNPRLDLNGLDRVAERFARLHEREAHRATAVRLQ